MKKLIFVLLMVVFLGIAAAPSAVAQSSKSAIIAQIEAQIKDLQAQIAQLTAAISALPQRQTNQGFFDFNTNLNFGMTGQAIETLQIALEKEGFFIAPEEKTAKRFDKSTASAVSGFQQKYGDEILTPLGLKYGTGFVGPTTRTKLNKLYGSDTIISCITSIMCAPGYVGNDSGKTYRGCPILECVPEILISCPRSIMCAPGYVSNDSGKTYPDGCPILECVPEILISCPSNIMCAPGYAGNDSGKKYPNGCPILECVPIRP